MTDNKLLSITPPQNKEGTTTKYIYELSKELNIEDTIGVHGNELELIALVRNCPFLYDKNVPDFKDSDKKYEAWTAIAKVMNATVEEVQKKWNRLREAFNKYNKELEQMHPVLPAKPWEFYEEMKFIEPHIHHRNHAFRSSRGWTPVSSTSAEDVEDSKHNIQSGEGNMPPGSHRMVLYFISLIQKQPHLYDSENVHYKDKYKKDKTWEQIAQKMGLSAEACEAKWRLLRDRYRRQRKHLKQECGNGKLWQFYEPLKFLDGHIRRRGPRLSARFNRRPESVPCKTSTSPFEEITFSEHELDDTTDTNDLQFEFEDATDGPAPLQRVEFVDPAHTYTSQSDSLMDESSAGSVPKIVVTSSSNQESNATPDEDDLFARSIAAELKRIQSRRKKMKIKADIYKLLYDNESD